MLFNNDAILKANNLVTTYSTTNPETIIKHLDIQLKTAPLTTFKGMYAHILRTRFIVVSDSLNFVERKIVLAHELGHDQLHSGCIGAFSDGSNFSYHSHKREVDANYFSAQLLIPDEDFYELIESGLTYQQIAMDLNVFPELLAMKVDLLRKQGIKIEPFDIGSKDYLKNRLR